MVRQFGNFEQIVDDAGHDSARFMRIEVGKRKRFHVAEKFATHIALYFYAQHVPEIGYDIRENAF